MFNEMMEVISVFNGEVSFTDACEITGLSGEEAREAFFEALGEFDGVTVKVSPTVSYTNPLKALKRFHTLHGKKVNPIDIILREEGLNL